MTQKVCKHCSKELETETESEYSSSDEEELLAKKKMHPTCKDACLSFLVFSAVGFIGLNIYFFFTN